MLITKKQRFVDTILIINYLTWSAAEAKKNTFFDKNASYGRFSSFQG